MAISKHQNERPAIVALIDAIDADEATIAEHTASITTLQTNLQAESDARQTADSEISANLGSVAQRVTDLERSTANLTTALTTETDARTNKDTEIEWEISQSNAVIALHSSELESIDQWQQDWQSFVEDFRSGQCETISLPASGSVSDTLTFSVPFAQNDDCIVLAQPITSASLALFDVSVTSADYAGFGYTITNNDTNPHDVKLGYVAIRTSRE